MSLVRCHSCNKKISNAATSCPGCGEPRPDGGWKKPNTGVLGWAFVLVLLMALAGKCGSDQPATTASKSPEKPREAVVNSPWDGSVWQVERYLERNLKDPDSFEAIDWFPVVKSDGAYLVRCRYRAKNSFGGFVIEDRLFQLSPDGDVIAAVDFDPLGAKK